MYLWVDPSDANRATVVALDSEQLDRPRPAKPDDRRHQRRARQFCRYRSGTDGTRSPGDRSGRGQRKSTVPDAADPAAYDFDLALHSMAPIANGKTANLAYPHGGFGILDTSAVVRDTDDHFISLNDKLRTPVPNFLRWGTGNQCAGHTVAGYSESHSAVPVPGRLFVLSTDEVYGTLTAPAFGWPSGWARQTNVPTRLDHCGARATDRSACSRAGRAQTTSTTTRVRGPCTPSTRDSSMSEVADGPLTQVSGARGSSRRTASGTDSTTWSARTTTRW
jgi:hypothetical protein